MDRGRYIFVILIVILKQVKNDIQYFILVLSGMELAILVVNVPTREDPPAEIVPLGKITSKSLQKIFYLGSILTPNHDFDLISE